MDNEYIKNRKTTLQEEFDNNAREISDRQTRQLRLQGAFAELTQAEQSSAVALEPKKPKESK